MAERTWEEFDTCFCQRADMEVSLEVEVIYPSDFLGDIPRVGDHRCSNSILCNQFSQGTCIYAGTNPDVDPFQDQ
jgi:hypothetical protein